MSTLLASLPRTFLCIIMFLRGWFLIILTILWLETHTYKKRPGLIGSQAEGFLLVVFLFVFSQAPSCSPEENICILLLLDDVLFSLLQSRNLIIQMCDLKQIKHWGFHRVPPPTHDSPTVSCCPLLLEQRRQYSRLYPQRTCFNLRSLQCIFTSSWYIFLQGTIRINQKWLALNLLQATSSSFPKKKFSLFTPKLVIVIWIRPLICLLFSSQPESTRLCLESLYFHLSTPPSLFMHCTVWRLIGPAAHWSINNLENI